MTARPGYPPYNIERTGENDYRITVAVAGFSEADLTIEAKENTLTIRGDKQARADEQKGETLYQGIAARAFERVFQLADFVQVKGAAMENGLLHVDLVREVPEAKKPRQIKIGASQPKVVEQKGCVSSHPAPIKRERPGQAGALSFCAPRFGSLVSLRKSVERCDRDHLRFRGRLCCRRRARCRWRRSRCG